ncbi:MAG: universal stress protein [Bacteroidota bacterium]
MIRRILVPIDLSDYSIVTIHYALAIAQVVEAKSIQVIHVFTPQTTGDALTIPPVGQLMNDREEMLKQFVAKHAADTDLSVAAELKLGLAVDVIVEESNHFDLLVMGCQGETDLIEEVFGSVSSNVAQQAHCPALLVPKRATFADYRNIMYASDNISLSRRAVLKLMDFTELFHARVHFVHVNDGSPRNTGDREKLFAPLFSNPNPEFPFEIAEVEADSVHEGIKSYLNQHPIDLSIMVTRKRGFWARLFHRSETKQFALHPETPLMVFHLED